MNDHEEEHELPRIMSWILVILLATAVVSWCMFIMMMVKDGPRTWDFGALPDVPAESIYSTMPAPPAVDLKETPLQFPKLPEARAPKRLSDPVAPRSDAKGGGA